MVVALLTLGDPGRLTGGYLYHQRMAEAAPRYDARIAFVSFPERPFPLAARDAPAVLRHVRSLGAQALVLDSIAAAFLGPWLVVRRPELPLIGMLHQPPGGIDHGPLRAAGQALLDRLAYRRARRVLVASDSLAEQLIAEGVPRPRVRVVPPRRDVAVPGATAGRPSCCILPPPMLGLHVALPLYLWCHRTGPSRWVSIIGTVKLA